MATAGRTSQETRADLEVVRARLRNQRMLGPAPATPAEVVRWLGAVQAQDYRGALWGVALRTRDAVEADVEAALADRSIARTWPMRGTLHFAPPGDVRWMLRHLATRVIRRSAGRYRELGLDDAAFARSRRLCERALAGGGQLTRPEMYERLARDGVSPEGQRGIHILGRLAMEGLLCFGPQRGKQPTFVLLEEWLPPAPVPERDEALAQLARRYFTGHGPATLADFAWWTGLPLGEARAALEAARPHLVESSAGGAAHFAGSRPARARTPATAHLLPAYDEYTVAYRERGAFLDRAHAESARNGIFSPVVVIDGRIGGTWRRRTGKAAVTITAEVFAPLAPAARRALSAAAARYGRFLGVGVDLDVRRAGRSGRAGRK
ncbi:MAG TPA: winged helix DNA-binding domain-containing protein [Kofleriaceae bacterium]|nr:winged helix DNA-binding domain-containing protein [Kofleriaceae bacterium]